MLRVCSQELLLSEREGGREGGREGRREEGKGRERRREGGRERRKRGKRERGKEGERRGEGRWRLREEGRINNFFLSHHLRRYLCQFLKLFFLDMHVFDWIQEWKTMRKTFLHFGN